jgi:phosphatidylcholine synthase
MASPTVFHAYAVHLYTASGLIWALLTLQAILAANYGMAFFWMIVAVVVDATDGTLARRWQVKKVLPQVDGRRMDDIIDFINYTFTPIFLLCHAGWLPDPLWFWGSIPLIASVFGFCSSTAKEEEEGFFGGFPSYWNVIVFYIATWLYVAGPYAVAAVTVFLSILSVAPVRFVYPNLAPRWRGFFLGGGIAWGLILLVMLIDYPKVSPMLWYVSLIYPILYTILSIVLDYEARSKAPR